MRENNMEQTERRRYFRIDDEVILAWRNLTTEEKNMRLQQFMLGEIEYPDATRLYLSLESDINSLVQLLHPKDPQVAKAISLLNRKINLVSRGAPTSATQHTLLEQQAEPVNISACGIAFMADQPLPLWGDIQIEMILIPEKTYILCYGVIVGCEHVAKRFRVNVDFVAMREDDRERLIQHIMVKESEGLRNRRYQHLKK
jgi:hypothetical protein